MVVAIHIMVYIQLQLTCSNQLMYNSIHSSYNAEDSFLDTTFYNVCTN